MYLTPVDEQPPTLKPAHAAFDSDHAMRLQELKTRVQRSDYHVDPATVAVAIIRHAVSHRRWWNPRTSFGTPPALSTTSAGPSWTLPIHVSGAADSAARRPPGPTHTQSS